MHGRTGGVGAARQFDGELFIAAVFRLRLNLPLSRNKARKITMDHKMRERIEEIETSLSGASLALRENEIINVALSAAAQPG